MHIDHLLINGISRRSRLRLWLLLMYVRLKIIRIIAEDAAQIILDTAAALLRGRLVDRRAWAGLLEKLRYLPLAIRVGLLHAGVTFSLLGAFQVPVGEAPPLVLP